MTHPEPRRVMLVYDDALVLGVAGDLLHAGDYAVQLLMYPTLTVATAQQFKPDLIVLDINMPVLNGREVLHSLKAFEGIAGVPVIFLTSQLSPRDQVRAFLAGGGRAIGSCGGAYYLSAGRPGWSGTADAMPPYTHEYRFFSVAPQSQLQGFCHWRDDRKAFPTVVLVHGLEGSSESRYMRGIAAKAFHAGFNVIRLNQRTCGGTEHLSPTLYNSGLSGDYRAIVKELIHHDGLDRVWLVGYSMGGNLVLKTAGEQGRTELALAGVAAVCANINPTICAHALEERRNWIYHRHFVTRLKARLR